VRPWRWLAACAALLAASWLAAPIARVQAEPSTLDRLLATPIPPRDPLDLYARMNGVDPATIKRVVNDSVPSYQVGRSDQFWVGNQQTGEYHQAQADLRFVSPHAYWYVEQGRSVPQQAIERSADYFESRTYPTVRTYFGSEWFPGIDNDPHVTVLMAEVPGVGAYFSSWDEYPRSVYVHSNEREMVHMNLDAVEPGSSYFDGVLAHEFQHMVHWYSNPNDETWVDEGSAELAHNIVLGGDSISVSGFDRQPDTQLTAWTDQQGSVGVHYEAAYLFMRYFTDHYGGPDVLYDLIAQRARGTDLFDSFLQAHGYQQRFPELYADFAVANLLDDPSVEGGRYDEPTVSTHPRVSARLNVGNAPLSAQVHQFGVDYVELGGSGTDATLDFRGTPSVRLVGADPSSGQQQWWSNRADGMDSELTREFDLSGVSSATLQFRTWYEIEKNYDYLYVMASSDGGSTWKVLPGTHTSTENPTGNGLGPGYTDVSGGGQAPVWTDERVDLSSFAGQRVLLRFEYITDQAFNRSGAAIDDIRIPEIGFADDAEQDAGWTANGFLRSDNHIPQSYQLRLIEVRSDGTHVTSLPVDSTGHANAHIAGLGGETSRAVLAVIGTAPRTLEVAQYQVALSPG
jgi:hypothetical protein